MAWNLKDLLTGYRDIPTTPGVYRITCVVTGKHYVGSSANTGGLRGRIGRHLSELRRNCHFSVRLQYAVNKYGLENFEFDILEHTSKENAVPRERFFINLMQACNPARGFNTLIDASSMLGLRHRPESIEKMKRIATGRPVLPEVRKKIGEAHRGKKQSDTHIANAIAARRGFTWSHSQRQKMMAHLEIPFKLEKDGVVYEGTGIKTFCKERGLNDAAVGAVILGRRSSYKGYRLPGVAPRKYPEYDVVSPTGEHHHVTNLNAFCKQHQLRQGNMWMMLKKGRGHCQGWTVVPQSDENVHFAPRLAVGAGFGDKVESTGKF